MGQKMEAKENPKSVESFLAIAPGCNRCMGSVQVPTLRLGRRMTELGWEVGEIVVVKVSREKIVVSRLDSAVAGEILDKA